MMKINRTSRFKKEYRQMMKQGYDPMLFERYSCGFIQEIISQTVIVRVIKWKT